MRELGKWARGLFAAGGLAAGAAEGVPDAQAHPLRERVEHEKPKESDIAWAEEAKATFDAAYAEGKTEAMADAVRAFVKEYHQPTRGDIRESTQHNPMRIMDKGELRFVHSVGSHFLSHAGGWGKEYPSLFKRVADVLVRIEDKIDEPGPPNAHKTYYGPYGDISRSQGFR